jgi:hypothetical protein
LIEWNSLLSGQLDESDGALDAAIGGLG